MKETCKKIIIRSEKQSNRLEYVLDYVFTYRLGISWQYEIDTIPENYSCVYLVYGSIHSNYLYIPSNGLLFENTTNRKRPNCTTENWAEEGLFWNNEQKGDWFSSIFWILSRYEEYQKPQLDNHDRVLGKSCWLFENNLLEIPVVDHWVKRIAELLNCPYQNVNRVPAVKVTMDVDNSYAIRGKNLKRTLGGLFRSVLDSKERFPLKERLKVLKGEKLDPYDTYDYFLDQCRLNNIQPLIFFLMADYGGYDNGLSFKSKLQQHIISYCSQNAEIGIHPSYASFENRKLFKKEMDKLKLIVGKEIIKSRQHFLRFQIPKTYQEIFSSGIVEDYSMGYADIVGFRAGTAHPFLFFDLTKNEKIDLKIIPLIAMDGTLNEYMKLSPMKAINKIDQLKLACNEVEGTFTVLWHNETLNDIGIWKGWRDVFESSISSMP